MLIDIHSHFDMLEDPPEMVLQKAKQVGVGKVITIGTELKDMPYVLQVAHQFYPDLYCTLGVHPHHGSTWDPEVAEFIEKHIHDKTVVAVGEIGLDYHYNQSPKEEQIEAFCQQMDLAEKYNMPVQIHTRDADEDTADILNRYKGRVKGVIHCFTSSEWLARQALDCGFNISMSGVVTFKNAQTLRETCKIIPLDRLHVETDAPFLAPVPMRGQKNQPAFVVHTAKVVADLHGISLEKLISQTTENAKKLFPRIV
jgi:TatD DNase family protein